MRKLSRRRVTWLFGAVLALAFILPLSQAAWAQVTLTHFVYNGHGDDHRRYIEERAEQFMAANPNIKIELIGASGDYWDKLFTMAAAGAAPDTLELYPESAVPFVASGIVKDLRPFIDRDPEINLDDYVPLTVEGHTWHGKVWGLPSSTYQIHAVYNVDLWDSMGLTDPNEMGSAWNWAALTDSARKLTVRRDDGTPVQWGLHGAHDFFRWWVFTEQAGGRIFDRDVDPGEATLLDPKVIEGLKYYTDFWTVEKTLTTDINNLYQGAVGMSVVMGPSIFGILANQGVSFEYDVTELPQGPAHNGTMVFLNGFQMAEQTKHPEEAWAWLKFLGGEEGLRRYTQLTGRTPARLSLLPEYIETIPNPTRHAYAAVDALLNPNSRMTYLFAGQTQIRSLINSVVGSQLITGLRSVEDVLQELNQQVNVILQDARSEMGN